MTEEEAKRKRCCGPEGCGDEPFGGDLGKRYCIGSACMAWRWNMDWSSMTEEGHSGDVVVRMVRREGEPRIGYCGLAGKP